MKVETFNDRFAAFLETVGLSPFDVVGLRYKAGGEWVTVRVRDGERTKEKWIRIETLQPTAKYRLENVMEQK